MNSKKTNRTAIIDVEIILYRCAAKAEAEGTGLDRLVQYTSIAIEGVVSSCAASSFYLVVSGRDNFRKTLSPTYKAKRGPKPPLYDDLSNAIKALYQKQWLSHPQIEADDLLGIMLTNGRVENPILCSIDKDLLGVSGWHYNWDKDCWPRFVSVEEANCNWLIQLLTGDATDGIVGMRGVGPVKAKKFVDEYVKFVGAAEVEPTAAAKYIYEKEGFSVDEYTECLNLVSIWRSPMPQALLENDLIREIAKTIPSLRTS